MSSKNFLFGLGIGIALTLVGLQAWSSTFERTAVWAAQPIFFRSFFESPRDSNPSIPLSRPWLPRTAERLHDNWELRRIDGKIVKLSEFHGKVVFLNFWSSGCAPCREQLPSIERLYASLKDAPVAFLLVTKDSDQQNHDFLSRTKMNLPVYSGKGDIPGDFPDQGMPATVILDRNGAIIFRDMGPLNWDDDKARTYIRSLASLH